MVVSRLASVLLCCSVPLHAQEWIQAERIDVRPDGLASTSARPIHTATISDDGRWVIFESDNDDLVAGDTNGFKDVFVRDRTLQITRRLSLRPGGIQAALGASEPHGSRDGRFVSFYSDDDALVAGDTNFDGDVFLLDRDSDGNGVFDESGGTSLQIASVNAAGSQISNGAEWDRSAVSDDGLKVVFATKSIIAPGDNNGKSDVHVRDWGLATTPLMSVSPTGVVGDDESPGFFGPDLRISNDGRHVGFGSKARNLVAGDGNFRDDVFVRDRDSDGNGIFDEPGGTLTRLASLTPQGDQFTSNIDQFDLDGTGRWVAFAGRPSPDNDNNPAGSDIYLNDLPNGLVERINFDAAIWRKADGGCCGNQFPLLSRDAAIVLFRSSQLYSFSPGVQTSLTDVFSWSRGGGLKRMTDFPPPTASGTGGGGAIPLALSANGKYAVLYDSASGCLVYSRNTVSSNGFETVE